MIFLPEDIKWKKKGKSYTTNVNSLADFLYIMYLIYEAGEKTKYKFLIDVKIDHNQKNTKVEN